MDLNINLIIAVIGGTVTLTGFFITRYLERKKDIEFQIRNKKIPVYEEFFEFYFRVVFNKDNELTHQEMVTFFQNFNQKAIIWFPDNILKSYIEWKKELISFSNNNNSNGNNEVNLKFLIIKQESLMKEFRKDIGHQNNNLIRGDISSLYINNIDKIL